MFRRRTDQVYQTLQQVQRRISEQTGTPPPPPGKTPAQPAPSSVKPVLPSNDPDGEPASAPPAPPIASRSALAPPVMPSAYSQPGDRGGVIHVSYQLAATLGVLWIITFVVGIFIGGRTMNQSAGAGYVAGEPGHRAPAVEAPPARGNRSANWIIVLREIARPKPEDEQQMVNLMAHYNDIMVKNSSRGWKPLFGLRRPESGDLQLVFGAVEGGFGVEKKEWEELFAMMTRSTAKQAAAFPTAKWMQMK